MLRRQQLRVRGLTNKIIYNVKQTNGKVQLCERVNQKCSLHCSRRRGSRPRPCTPSRWSQRWHCRRGRRVVVRTTYVAVAAPFLIVGITDTSSVCVCVCVCVCVYVCACMCIFQFVPSAHGRFAALHCLLNTCNVSVHSATVFSFANTC